MQLPNQSAAHILNTKFINLGPTQCQVTCTKNSHAGHKIRICKTAYELLFCSMLDVTETKKVT